MPHWRVMRACFDSSRFFHYYYRDVFTRWREVWRYLTMLSYKHTSRPAAAPLCGHFTAWCFSAAEIKNESREQRYAEGDTDYWAAPLLFSESAAAMLDILATYFLFRFLALTNSTYFIAAIFKLNANIYSAKTYFRCQPALTTNENTRETGRCDFLSCHTLILMLIYAYAMIFWWCQPLSDGRFLIFILLLWFSLHFSSLLSPALDA